jgi:hypothetical protein
MALTNLKAAINAIGLAQLERGNTQSKRTLLSQALASLATAFTSDTSLTGSRVDLARSFQDSVQFALDAENNVFNGAAGPVMATRVRSGVDYLDLHMRETSGGLPTNLAQIWLAILSASPAMTFSPSSLPSGTHGVAYSQQLTVSGGDGSSTFTLVSGSFPTSININSSGLISGTTSDTGTFSSIVIKATDASGNTGTKTYSLVIA